jgi:hypothetical protein
MIQTEQRGKSCKQSWYSKDDVLDELLKVHTGDKSHNTEVKYSRNLKDGDATCPLKFVREKNSVETKGFTREVHANARDRCCTTHFHVRPGAQQKHCNYCKLSSDSYNATGSGEITSASHQRKKLSRPSCSCVWQQLDRLTDPMAVRVNVKQLHG